MKWIPYGLMIFGLLCFAIAGEAAYKGVFKPRRGKGLKEVHRHHHPEQFRQRMQMTCLEGGVWVFAGYALLRLFRGVDRSNPLSTEFESEKALDELEEELRRRKKAEDG